MSLVHELVIGVLNRRFVTCYFSVFPDIGYDRAGANFTLSLPSDIARSFTFILTPEGEVVETCGIGHDELVRTIRSALKRRPEYAWMTPQEQQVLDRVRLSANDFDAHLQAALLFGELLELKRADAALERAIQVASTQEQRNLAYYHRGHLALLNPDGFERADVLDAFSQTKQLSNSLRDDMAMDKIRLDIEMIPRRGMFTYGYRLSAKRDALATMAELRTLIDSYPNSNRIGQMHFYLGLAHIAAGDVAAANAIWESHFTRYPEDRWAMLSRMHHGSYGFSPYTIETPPTAPTNADNVSLVVVSSKTVVEPQEEFVVDVFVRGAVNVHTFQTKLLIRGGDAGSLDCTDIWINADRSDYVFYNLQQAAAVDQKRGRLGAVLFGGGADATGSAYLGTYTFRASPNAVGTFIMSVDMDVQPVPLWQTESRPIEVHHFVSATVEVIAKHSTRGIPTKRGLNELE